MRIERLIEKSLRIKAGSLSKDEVERLTRAAFDYVMVGYTLMNAADILFRRGVEHVQQVRPQMQYEDKMRIGELSRCLHKALSAFETGSVGIDDGLGSLDPGAYDRMRGDAYEIVRLVLLVYSRTCENPQATAQLEEFLMGLPDGGMFPIEDIESFRMR